MSRHARAEDPGAPARSRATAQKPVPRGYHLHTRVIPALRLAGFAVVAALIPIHNAAAFGKPDWAAAQLFAGVTAAYCLASWQLLKRFFLQSRRVHLGNLFLALDLIPLLAAIQITGGPRSLIFFLPAARCLDQLWTGVRRTVWFNFATVGGYLGILAIAFGRHIEVNWPAEIAKIAALFALNSYCCLMAWWVESARRRAVLVEGARRSAADSVGTLVHELRTLVTGLEAPLEVIQKAPLTERQRESAQALGECGRNLKQLVAALEHPSAEGRAPDSKAAPVSLAGILDDVASLMRVPAMAKCVDLRVELFPATPELVHADGRKLLHILLSLVQHAVALTDYGHVQVRVWLEEPGRIAFEVRDSGSGIRAEVRRRCLAHFHRADGSAWHEFRGPHASLAVASHLVESLGGVMEIDGEVGTGAKVRFTLGLRAAIAVQ